MLRTIEKQSYEELCSKNLKMASFSQTISFTLTQNPNSLHFNPSILTLPSHFFFPSSANHHINLHRSFSGFPSNPNRSIRRCRAGSDGPPPQRPDPPPGANLPVLKTGVTVNLSRIWDSVQIFTAVLFWMALFFWASAWDGKNNRKRNNGDRFRR